MTRNRFGAMACAAAFLLVGGCLPGRYPHGSAHGFRGATPARYGGVGKPAAPELEPASPPPPTARGAAPEPGKAVPVSPRGRVVAGLNAGFMIADGIGPGAELTFTYRLDEFVGFRFSVGHYDIRDQYRKERLTPILARAVFATPLRWSKAHRNYWGIGVGRFISDGDGYDYYFPPAPNVRSEETVYVLEWGREYLLEDLRRARAQIGFYMNERVGGVSFTFGMDFGG